MGNVLVREETLSEIADSIREKNGLTDLYKPSAMPEAIRSITTGSGERPNEDKPVRFYGLTGELLYSFTLEEAAEMTALPELPEYEGLICQGWNWSLENIKNAGREIEVGSIFITDDGATRVYVSINEGTLDPYLGFYQETADSVRVDWGDGSPMESSAEAGTTVWFTHQYQEPGDYVVRLVPEEGAVIYIKGSLYGSSLFAAGTSSSKADYPYAATIKKIEIGSNVTSINGYGLNGRNVEYVTVPNGLETCRPSLGASYSLKYFAYPQGATEISGNSFSTCYSLERVVFCDTMKTIGSTAFKQCGALEVITFPDTVTTISSSAFTECTRLKRAILPGAVKTIAVELFEGCKSLEQIIFPVSATTIESQALYGCESLKILELPEGINRLKSTCFSLCNGLSCVTIPSTMRQIEGGVFSSCTGVMHYYIFAEEPPTLSASNIFSGIADNCKIHVPKGCLEAYQTADYWIDLAAYMVEMEE